MAGVERAGVASAEMAAETPHVFDEKTQSEVEEEFARIDRLKREIAAMSYEDLKACEQPNVLILDKFAKLLMEVELRRRRQEMLATGAFKGWEQPALLEDA